MVLDKIIESKRREIAERKELYPVKWLEQSIYFSAQPVSLRAYLRRVDKSGIIAEFKRKSPSRGAINPYAKVEKTTIGYMQAGASALSVLTDNPFFGGSKEDLTEARKFNFCPILRKDFVLDEYQIIEAKSIGADAVLLIARILDKSQINKFTALANSLGMEVLLEIHEAGELDKLVDGIHVVGVNNRNLDTLVTDIEVSKELAHLIPPQILKISESGIHSPEVIHDLREYGYEGFLMGEFFMQHARPELACKEFIQKLNPKSNVHVA
jgi:indole-3-glycerol phosphate synthase